MIRADTLPVNVSDFDFDLPDELIAQEPPAERGAQPAHGARSRQRRASRITSSPICRRCCAPGDLLVVNDTRVFPGAPDRHAAARRRRRRMFPGPARPARARHLDRAGASRPAAARGIAHGVRVGRPVACTREIVGRHFHGRRTVRLWTDDGSPVRDAIDAIGHVPLPPYIKRAGCGRRSRSLSDRLRARARIDCGADRGPALHAGGCSRRCAARGVERASITLHVGYGTFQPIRVERVEEHQMEAGALRGQRRGGRGAVARAARRAGASLRSARRRRARSSRSPSRPTARCRQAQARRRSSSIPATSSDSSPGLITNFHLPRSSLLDAGVGVRRPRARCWPRIEKRWRTAIGSIVTATRC